MTVSQFFVYKRPIAWSLLVFTLGWGLFSFYAAVPFGLVGGLMGLLFFNVPLGFFAGLGLSSRVGVIVSHVIVLFEYIEEAHQQGETVRDAVVDAGLARLRPVLVTVLATVGGLIPLALKGGPLWEPLCYVQIIGLLAATGVTLLLVPVLYVVFVENLGLVRWDPPGTHVDVSASEISPNPHRAAIKCEP